MNTGHLVVACSHVYAGCVLLHASTWNSDFLPAISQHCSSRYFAPYHHSLTFPSSVLSYHEIRSADKLIGDIISLPSLTL